MGYSDVFLDPVTEYTQIYNENDTLQICFNKSVSHGSGLWQENSLGTTIPLFALQFAIILTFNRILLLVSAPWRLPRIVTDIFAGVLVGPSLLGSSEYFVKNMFPYSSMVAFETMANLFLVYHIFLVGQEVEVKTIKRSGNMKAIAVAILGIIFSFLAGIGLYYLLVGDMGRKTINSGRGVKQHIPGAMFWGIALSCSEFSEISKILADLKLLLSENGQLVLTAALTNDLFSWIFLVMLLPVLYWGPTGTHLLTFSFALLCLFVIRPLVDHLFKKVATQDREYLEIQVIFALHLVLVLGFFTDGLGSHSISGAYILGAITPKGVFKNAIQDKVLDFVTSFMMPLYFATVGIRVNVYEFFLHTHWSTVVVVIVLACMTKILCTFLVSMLYHKSPVEGLSLGLLMNTKGIVSIIALSSARDRGRLDNEGYGVMLIACWLMTIPVGPILAAKDNLTSDIAHSQRRNTMQGTRPDSPLRVLACVMTQRDGNSITNLLKASNPTVQSPIQVFAVELMKRTSRPATALIIKDANKSNRSKSNKNYFGSSEAVKTEADILSSFENLNQAIFAENLRVISAYNTMHKDIFNLANQREVTLILATFHKEPTYDGFGVGTATARAANIVNRDSSNRDEKRVVLENLVNDTPCCLGIFVDRGFGQKREKELRLAMFYVGGPDDREALSYAWRMSKNPYVQLTVVRLIWDNPSDEYDRADDEYLRYFKYQNEGITSVRCLEKVLKDEKETVALLNKMGAKGFDLYIIGRGHGRKMSLAQTVDPVLEEPALGPLGDALADLNSAAETSILIIQTQAGDNHEFTYHNHDTGGHINWRPTHNQP